MFGADSKIMSYFGPKLLDAHDHVNYIKNPLLIFPVFQRFDAEIANDVYLINATRIPEDSEPVFLVNDLFFKKCIPNDEPDIQKILDTKLLNNGKNIINLYMNYGLHCFGAYFEGYVS